MISGKLQGLAILIVSASFVQSFLRGVDGFLLLNSPPPLLPPPAVSQSSNNKEPSSLFHQHQQRREDASSTIDRSLFFRLNVHTPSTTSTAETTTTTPTTTGTQHPPTEITSHVDWMELLHGHDDDRLTLVLFKASFCKSCLRLEQDWRRKVLPLAGAEEMTTDEQRRGRTTSKNNAGNDSNHNKKLDLATVEFTKNRALFKELGVDGLPTVHFYYQGRLLTGYSCPPKEFSRVMDSLHHYLDAAASSPHELEFEANMEGKRQSFLLTNQQPQKEKERQKIPSQEPTGRSTSRRQVMV